MKASRQKKILEILKNREIATQTEMARALRAAGFDVTQATVSRDIKELRLVKIPVGNDNYRYGLPQEQNSARNEQRLCRMMQELVVEIADSENIVVLRTYPGNAHAIAALLDGAAWPEILGTVAGDDTIMLVIRTSEGQGNRKEVKNVVSKLKSLME